MVTQSLIRVPEYGSCFDTRTNTVSRCVLSSRACPEVTEVYVPAYEANLPCHDPDDVVIGRCVSAKEDNRCAASPAACGGEFDSFKAVDTTCSVSGDIGRSVDGYKPRTIYPACKHTDTHSHGIDNEWQCALDHHYCLSDETMIDADFAAMGSSRPCHCGDVPTGVCYRMEKGPTETELLTPANAFCAISPRDCPPTHGWMSARLFMSLDRATFQCRLCDHYSKQANSYLAGACQEDGAPTASPPIMACALEGGDCPTGTNFVSAYSLLERGLHCPAEATRNWGKCESSGKNLVECTNKAESCEYGFNFTPSIAECNIYGHTQTSFPTYFGYCLQRNDNEGRDRTGARCVWDEAECDPAWEWWQEARPPNPPLFQGCVCEDVLTGVCRDPSGNYHCAVSAAGCADPSSYVPQRLLEERGIDIRCPLCPPRPPAPLAPAPKGAPAAAPAPLPNSVFGGASESSGGRGAGTVTVIVLATLALSAVVVYLAARRRRGAAPSLEGPAAACGAEPGQGTGGGQGQEPEPGAEPEPDHDEELVPASSNII